MFLFSVALCSMWDFSSPTGNWTHAPGIGSTVLTPAPRGKSLIFVLKFGNVYTVIHVWITNMPNCRISYTVPRYRTNLTLEFKKCLRIFVKLSNYISTIIQFRHLFLNSSSLFPFFLLLFLSCFHILCFLLPLPALAYLTP